MRCKNNMQNKRSLWWRIKVNRHKYVLIAPFMIFFTIFTVIPILAAVFLSLTDYNLVGAPDFIGLANYSRIFFNDEVFLTALRNTLLLALVTGPLGYLLCWIVAWFINDFPKWLRTVLTFVFYVPSLVGNVYFIWTYIFSGDSYGLLNSFLLSIGAIPEAIQWLTDVQYNMIVVIVVQLWMSLGVSFLAFIAGFQSMDRSLFEAGAIDGVRNRWQELWYITLPQMKPSLLFGAVMQISSAFSISAVPQMLTGFPSVNYSTHTLVLHITDFGTIRFEMGYACALATILFLLMFFVKFLVEKLISMVGQ